MDLEIVRLIYGIRRYGLHRTLRFFDVDVPTTEAFLADHGFQLEHRTGTVEHNYKSQPGGRGLSDALSHVEDVERHVDEALGLRVGNKWPVL